ncbi:MAG TPA: zinc ribbon domain-containing protein [Blastocatellia bacterium]
MYCPKCGAEALEGQRFCKACGTNLQLIINIVKGGGRGPGPWHFDPEELKRNVTDFVDSWKKGFPHEHAGKHWDKVQLARSRRQSTRELRRRARDEVRRRNLPQPGQWMKYSRQHNLKEGLISLFSGGALSFVFYKVGQEVLNSGVIQEIPHRSDSQTHGLEVLARIFWLFMLIPLLKGLGQLIYATFFAESMATLTERFTIPADELIDDERAAVPAGERQTAPQPPPSAPTRDFERLEEPPASVTENTTQFFEGAGVPRRRESQ